MYTCGDMKAPNLDMQVSEFATVLSATHTQLYSVQLHSVVTDVVNESLFTKQYKPWQKTTSSLDNYILTFYSRRLLVY